MAGKADSHPKEDFAYEPLRSSDADIRLLRLQPGTQHEDISCTLVHTSIKDHEPYEAVSYCWGDQTDTRPIWLHKKLFVVRENLWWFLFRIRSTRKERLLWVDAVCINQDAVPERNAQVQLMRHIYQEARMVYVWLGEAADNSDLAMKLGYNLWYESDDGGLPAGRSRMSIAWEALSALCHREYWRRTWIIQEVILASHIVIWCGSQHVSWRLFEDLFERLSQSTRRKHRLQAMADVRNSLPATFHMQRKAIRSGEDRDLKSLLKDYRYSHCTDVRDRVYAILGLASDTATTDQMFQVDYSKSLPELRMDVLRWCNPSNSLAFGHFVNQVLGSAGDQESDRREQGILREIHRRHSSTRSGMVLMQDCGFYQGDITRCELSTLNRVLTTERIREICTMEDGIPNQYKLHLDFLERVLVSLQKAVPDDIQSCTCLRSYGVEDRKQLSRLRSGPALWRTPSAEDFQLEEARFVPPRLIFTTYGQVGLGCYASKAGDQIYQFAESEIALIVRPELDRHRIVGRAVLAKLNTKDETDIDPYTGEAFQFKALRQQSTNNLKPLKFYIDPLTLLKLTR